ncbi:endocuticle structural glycoprotein SgAbd-2-like [Ctenocephalides felis]|uniref:endocuticle structural glycoprotein SgAbd-2-like n=1 Tax=Ctenocephalides felis TaxID=7515 RepID=UPI000E6E2356|nr:endocuticle structural glycoprotein SgAbd-2-like [Ctenocephalides felis]
MAVAYGAAIDADKNAEVLQREQDVQPEGYSYSYSISNGIAAQEQGRLQNDAIAAQGSFQFTAPDGTQVQLTYVADEEGFHPQGPHLPTPPPIPDHVLKSIQYIESHPPPSNR